MLLNGKDKRTILQAVTTGTTITGITSGCTIITGVIYGDFTSTGTIFTGTTITGITSGCTIITGATSGRTLITGGTFTGIIITGITSGGTVIGTITTITGTLLIGDMVMISDINAVYNLKVGLKQSARDLGFFDAYSEPPEPVPPEPPEETFYLVDSASNPFVDDNDDNFIYE